MTIVLYVEQFEGPMPAEGDVNGFNVLIGPFGSKKHVFEKRAQIFSRHKIWQLKNLAFFQFLP